MKLRLVTGAFLVLAVSAAHGRDLPDYNAYYEAARSTRTTTSARGTVTIPGRIASVDEHRGVPTFIWANRRQLTRAPKGTPQDAATWYLARFADAYRLGRAALGTSYVSRVHDTGRGGIMVVFRQKVDGVEVIRNEMKVLMTRDKRLVALGGNLHEAAVPQKLSFAQAPEQALAGAFSDLHGLPVTRSQVTATGEAKAGYRYYQLKLPASITSTGVSLSEPARVKRVLFPMPDRLVPGYYVEFFSTSQGNPEPRAHAYVMAASDGKVLMRQGLTESDAFGYRVWADSTAPHTPLDGPHVDFTPHPTGRPDNSFPEFIDPVLVTMEGFNTNPMGMPDPWLPAGATETRGNNVDAYADLGTIRGDGMDDGFTPGTDYRADITAPGLFDRVFDTASAPNTSQDQIKAAVTQLFYTTNWLHDYFYDSGFTEAAGNAQDDNYGRGGVGGDSMRAEAQDHTGRNNANMSTPADGTRPRMQMYVWGGRDRRSLTANGTLYTTGAATYGPQNFDVTGDLVLSQDGGGASATDGCEPITNVAGRIALIDRGNCNFETKTQNAQDAGAVAVVIANDRAGAPPGMSGTRTTITIPTLSVTIEAGQALRTALTNGPVVVAMQRAVEIDRDGTIDNTIVAHEWGHYIHRRLSPCGSTIQCRAQSEGWGDFVALFMASRENEDPYGVYPLAGYSTWLNGDSFYYGIRRAPYSTNPRYNALSFRHIQLNEPLPTTHPILGGTPNNGVHNAGEIWASMMWDAYVSLIERTRSVNPPYTFAEAKRRMADYLVLGMQLGPVDATYTEQRDAILAAAFASDYTDFLAMAQAFSERGAGSCAESPARSSTDLIGVTEDTSLRARMEVVSIALSEGPVSCDMDRNFDGGETGHLVVTIANDGAAPLIDTQLMVSFNHPSVTAPNGGMAPVAAIAPYSTGTVMVEVTADDVLTQIETLEATVTLTNARTCETTQTAMNTWQFNLDPVPSAVDPVDYPRTSWTESGMGPSGIWKRATSTLDPTNYVLYGVDFANESDNAFESQPIQVSATDPFLVSFRHRHSFEVGPDQTGVRRFWDGGVIELGIDNGGATMWQDISTLGANPGYGGVLTDVSGNPLANRDAYVARNASWPNFDTVMLDLGTQLAGQTVRLRYRIGTDESTGGFGWEIDDISVQGTANLPFAVPGPDEALCNGMPVADAGPDQTVEGGTTVALDASGSMDPEGDRLTFRWSQVAGPEVTLRNAASAVTSFVTPMVPEDTTLTFAITVSDGQSAAMDLVDVTVLRTVTMPDAGVPDAAPADPDAAPSEPDAAPGGPDAAPGGPDAGTGVDAGGDAPDDGTGGCGCQTGSTSPGGSALLSVLSMLAVAWITRRRKRA